MGDAYATAFKLLTLGFSVIPSGGGDKSKAPLVNWRDCQTTAPDESQLEAWERELNPALWGIVTNDRIAVIDADTPETRVALEAEIGEPHVTTPRGSAIKEREVGRRPFAPLYSYTARVLTLFGKCAYNKL